MQCAVNIFAALTFVAVQYATLSSHCFFLFLAWKRAFFLSFIDLRLKRAVKIEASAKKKQQNKQRMLFSTLVVETGLYVNIL